MYINLTDALRKILDNEQKKEIKHITDTFGNPILLKPKEMAILNSPDKFPSTNKPRLNKMVSDRAEEVFKELTFLFEHLPSSYTNKILAGKNFDNFQESTLQLNKFTGTLDDKTRDEIVRAASQNFINSLAVIKESLPNEFQKAMTDTAKPFLEWLKAISDYGQKHSLKDIPEIHIPNKLMI